MALLALLVFIYEITMSQLTYNYHEICQVSEQLIRKRIVAQYQDIFRA